MAGSGSQGRPRALTWLSWAAAVAGAAYLVHLGRAATAAGFPVELGAREAAALGVATLCYLAAVLVSAGGWNVLLRLGGARLPPRAVVWTYLVSQPAKYLPGNVGHQIGRLALVRARGVPVEIGIAALVSESLATVIAGGAVALPVLGATWLAAPGSRRGLLTALALAAAAVVALRLRRRRAGSPGIATGGRGLAACLSLYLVVFVLHGAAAATLAEGMFAARPGLLFLTGAFAAAWLAGFLAPGVPAGLAVREGVLAALLSQQLPAAVALGLPMALRVAAVCGDGLAFAAGVLMRPAARARETGDGR